MTGFRKQQDQQQLEQQQDQQQQHKGVTLRTKPTSPTSLSPESVADRLSKVEIQNLTMDEINFLNKTSGAAPVMTSPVPTSPAPGASPGGVTGSGTSSPSVVVGRAEEVQKLMKELVIETTIPGGGGGNCGSDSGGKSASERSETMSSSTSRYLYGFAMLKKNPCPSLPPGLF